MEGRVICALSYWLLERQRRRGRREGVRVAEREGEPRGRDERWMVDTKRG